MLKELGGNILIDATMLCKLKGNVQHGKAVECHPAGAVSLFKDTTRGQWLGAVEETDIIESQEATFKDIFTVCIFSVYPPRKVKQKLLEDSLKKINILAAIQLSLNLERSEGGPGVYWRVDIAKIPFISLSLS